MRKIEENTLFNFSLLHSERKAFLMNKISMATNGKCEDLFKSKKFDRLIDIFIGSKTATNFDFWNLMNLFYLPEEVTNAFEEFSIKNPKPSKENRIYDFEIENEIYLLLNHNKTQKDVELLNELNLFYSNIIGISQEESAIINSKNLSREIQDDLEEIRDSHFHEGNPEILVKIYSEITSKTLDESRTILGDYWGISWYYEMCLGII